MDHLTLSMRRQKSRREWLEIRAQKSNWPETLSRASLDALLRRAEGGRADLSLTPQMRRAIEERKMKPSDNAVNFEAVKVSMSQNKDGVMLKLAIHPNDCPSSLHTDWVGARYVVALVKINDDETVVEDRERSSKRRAVAIAGSMCRNSKFQGWLVDNGIADTQTEDGAVDGIKLHLGISSRRELETDDVAREKFMSLVRSFESEMRGGPI